MSLTRAVLLMLTAGALVLALACGDDDDEVAPTQAAGGNQVATIQNFVHISLTVAVGTELTWENADGVPHTTTSTGGEWDSGSLGAGDRFSFTFTTAGSFDYVCAIHPRMTGTISVE